jgi:hypothetical protein
MIRTILFAVMVFLSAMTAAAAAAPLRIVAIGASNTQGWYMGNQGAYPAKLQALLKAEGIDAQVVNAGVPFDTTAGMLKRIDRDVPTGFCSRGPMTDVSSARRNSAPPTLRRWSVDCEIVRSK